MKKIRIETYMNLDNVDSTRTLSKLKFAMDIVDSTTGEVISIPKQYEYELGVILKQILTRWDNTSNSFTLTAAQWNALQTKIQSIIRQNQ